MSSSGANRVDWSALRSSGEETFSRLLVSAQNIGISSGQLKLTCFTARKTEPITQIMAVTGTTAAGATPTLCRYGVYQLDANDNGTLVASTPNDTTLWAAAATSYAKALSSTWSKVAGQRYALGLVIVTAAATPTFGSAGADIAPGMRAEMAATPRLSTALPGQTDLPASFAAGSLVASDSPYYFAALP